MSEEQNPFEDAAQDGRAQLVTQEDNPVAIAARAEIDVQITTAKRYPRTISMVKKKMLEFATLDQETAASCFYKLPRGGKVIEGPSIRLAEIATSCFQNLRVETKVVDTDTTSANPHVTIRAMCFDLENNVAVAVEKRRRIVGKKSKGGVPDEDDINLATNAGSAIALRDAVFKVVPLALVKPVFEQAKRTATGDVKTLSERRGKCVETFSKIGIDQARLLAKLDKKSVEDIGLEDLELLIGLFTAIKDGQANIDEEFPPLKPGSEEPKPAARAKKEEAPAKSDTKAEPAAQQPPSDPMAVIATLRNAIAAVDVTEEALITYCRKNGLAKDTQKLSDLATTKLQSLLSTLPTVIESIRSSQPA